MQPSVREFRERYRKTILPRFYSGPLHFAFTSLSCLGVITWALSRLDAVTWTELLIVPATFLLANFVEYRGHRGPMHHPVPGIRLLFERHTLYHHHFFTREEMTYESSRDYHMVLFPMIGIFAYLGVVALPIGLLVRAFLSGNAAFLYTATAVGYFLNYEWLHFAYHARPESWVGRLPFMSRLRQHHAFHHDLSLMSRWNFNITYPIADLVHGTFYRERSKS